MNGATFSYAGFWKRFAAYLIDSILLGVLSFFVLIPLVAMLGIVGSEMSSMEYEPEDATAMIAGFIGAYLMFMLVITVGTWLYFALMESSKNQGTLGKMALGIKVTDLQGNRITFGRATGRYFAKFISAMVLMIGYIIAGFTEKKQALHDIIASCLVVNK
ncbi:MAG: hypothetical protein A2X67_11580 [Ignavibacteria bacterium GWA2_55_11]|nr:MAG: hypothetical protein A2X67_11580 [Ignavibacteria bacterium GWA2_55_11]OGU46460.1 MAG: hypothetical protein A2X68_04440 [Ignavibacteria bacterium GWC2_56_12]OGU67295.1 MAG: hypothetical protein A3C56_11825 [Ignavibacteria bacterium RIFCSPHIGHO2_02_FULL_56_12]OGU72329.1 MAG: hypothetical protein A3H45_08350 [Ignavibacteria bacterium RIFCSPLOWO2_02_FULL_55_14]OGU75216.1 MAG: hypothetical protein A3G43_05330 [Ignavibacteria bacterium RIFCSPLOWO2_12_FULL_56_21]HAV23348.1 RDD family protein 